MGRINLTEGDWEKFFDMLYRIVHGTGTWSERKSEVEDAANVHSLAPSDLDEFAGWFTDPE